MNEQTNEQTNERTNGQTNEQADGQTTNARATEQTNKQKQTKNLCRATPSSLLLGGQTTPKPLQGDRGLRLLR